MSYSRSYSELIKIKLEIIWESCVDFFLDYYPTFRKALICLVAGAIALSIRTSQKGVSSYGTSYKNGFLPSLIGKKASTKIYNPSSQYGLQHGASQARLADSQRSSNQLINGNSFEKNSPPQRSTVITGKNQAALGVQYSTSQLVDRYGLGSLQVVQGGYFKDYGGASTFSGQIQTLNAVESPSLVEKILQTPGQGQILVVDGGGSLNGAVFDFSMATIAVQNGWKGIIINGVIRNVHSLGSLQFGVKAIGTHPTKGTQNAIGQPGLGLSFAGVNFSPGFWIYADKDGIVVSQTSLGIMGGATRSGNLDNVMQNGMGQQNQQYATGQQNQQYATGQQNQQNVMTSNSQFQNGLSSNRGTTSQYQQGTTNNRFPSQTGYQGGGIAKNGISSTSTTTTTAGGVRSSYGKPAGSYNSLYSKSGGQYGSGSYGYGRKKSTFTKKKMIGLLLLIIAIVWCCLGDF